MKFIVLTISQKDDLEALKASFIVENPDAFTDGSDFQCIEIKNDLWILPLSVLKDAKLREFMDYWEQDVDLDLYIREVLEDEFIKNLII